MAGDVEPARLPHAAKLRPLPAPGRFRCLPRRVRHTPPAQRLFQHKASQDRARRRHVAPADLGAPAARPVRRGRHRLGRRAGAPPLAWTGALQRRSPPLVGVRTAKEYTGKRVLVVGAGNSGIDIAGHLVTAGAHVELSMRTPPNLARRDILGLPGQPLLVLVADHLPARLSDFSFSITQRLLFGDLAPFGLPRAKDGPYANFHRRLRNPAIDDGFVAALKRGKAKVVAEVARLDGPTVLLADGTQLCPDAIICATGYRRGLEDIVGHLGVLATDGVPVAYHGAPEHPAAPRLYFAGMWGQFSGEIRLGPRHARRIARAASRDRANTARACSPLGQIAGLAVGSGTQTVVNGGRWSLSLRLVSRPERTRWW